MHRTKPLSILTRLAKRSRRRLSTFRRPSSSLRRLAAATCVLAGIGVAYYFALVMVRSQYVWYDDEGFMLMTLRQYTGGTPLYDRMYTEYGPFYYVTLDTLFRLIGASIGHDQIRRFTIGAWLITALAWSFLVWVWSRSAAWTVAALLTTIVVLRPLNGEPGHPQLVILLLFSVAFVVSALYGRLRSTMIFATLGMSSAAMLLTKINVGILVLAGLATLFTASLRANQRATLLPTVVHATCVAIPVVLMHRRLLDPAAVLQCAVYTFGIWALIHLLRREVVVDIPWSDISSFLAGGLAIVVSTVLAVLVHGTSPGALVDGIVMQPLEFSRAVPLPPASPFFLVIAVLCCVTSLSILRSHNGQTARPPAAAAFAVIIVAVVSPPLVAAIAPAIVWIFVPRSIGSAVGPGTRFSRLVVTVAATLALLMTYPVSGTQAYIAASLVVLAAFGALVESPPGSPSVLLVRVPRMTVSRHFLCAVVLIGALYLIGLNVALSFWLPRTPAHLPNSTLIRLSPEHNATMVDITARVSALCQTLVTIPGMNSFHIWSGLPHPNGFIVSAAMVLFDPDTQERLRRDFLASPRPCVIFNPHLERWSARFRPARPDQPFVEMVRTELALVYARDGYEIRVPRAEVSAWR